jgi:alkylhydroperoxidase/carboxymuconolactone decarboxylase family protein YurZ
MPAQPIDPAEAVKRLAAVKAKRGYLLPHHGLMALTAPELLEAYDATYTALTLLPRALSEHDREFVWLGVLTVRREHIASQHLVKFLKAGGTPEEVDLIVRLAAVAEGAGATAFIAEHWQHHLPAYDRKATYRGALDDVIAGARGAAKDLRPGLIHQALAAVHGCLQRVVELEWHIAECYRLNVPEVELAEALSYVMFSGSVPFYIEACGVWQRLIKDGKVPAGAPFKAWAAMDMGGPG